MHTRTFCGRGISEIGLGTWQLGGAEWGNVSEGEAIGILNAAAEAGVTFIDTADIYGLGRSETLIGAFLKQHAHPESFFIATKLGRGPEPGWPENFTKETITRHTEDSLKRLGVEAIDLTQTHCIPHEVMERGEVWEVLGSLKDAGKIKAFGASVESMDEALTCCEVEGMASLQIIFNVFRRKPAQVLFETTQRKNIGVIVRLALASGLLTGKMEAGTIFPKEDHRNFNRDGAAFNAGETFAGLPFDYALARVEEIRAHVPEGMTMAQMALRWCLDFDAVSVVIPGASKVAQVAGNAAASDLERLPDELHEWLRDQYEDVKDHIRGAY